MVEKYVDNVNLVINLVKEGLKWTRRRGSRREEFCWSEVQLIKDREGGTSKEEVMFEKVRILASELVQGIVFTTDLPERHTSGRVPMLDVEVWKEAREEGGVSIRHSYYENPSISPFRVKG